MQAAIERAIAIMWERYDEPLTLDEMADTAILSKFYFSRVFRAFTGTSPGRFLSAIRLHRAKSLLLETSMSVTDISYQVGYNSLGTFTSRFTRSVGVSPARYRAHSEAGTPVPSITRPRRDSRRPCAVRGLVEVPYTGLRARVYVAAFPDPIPQGMPGACDVLDAAGEYRLDALPDGIWYVRAAVVAIDGVDPRPWNRRPLFIGASEAVSVRTGCIAHIDLQTREFCPFDLPILLALPELDSWQPAQLALRDKTLA